MKRCHLPLLTYKKIIIKINNMEQKIVELISTENGIERKRISLVNPPKQNVMAKAHSYFSKAEKKEAKLNYKLNR